MPEHESEFEKAARDPQSWLKQAEQFLFSAKSMATNIRQIGPRNESSLQKQNGALKSTLLLLSICVENSLKAIKISSCGLKFKGGKISKDSFSGGNSGHDLNKLAQYVSLELSQNEEDFIRRLSKIAIWAGRFQYPLSSVEYEGAKSPNVRQVTLPDNIETVERIYERACKMVNDNNNSCKPPPLRGAA